MLFFFYMFSWQIFAFLTCTAHNVSQSQSFTVKNNNWLNWNMYHIMYNDGISRCQVALTVVPYERLRVQFIFLFFSLFFFLFCFVLDENYGIEITWLKTKNPSYYIGKCFDFSKITCSATVLWVGRLFRDSPWLNKWSKIQTSPNKHREYSLLLFAQ